MFTSLSSCSCGDSGNDRGSSCVFGKTSGHEPGAVKTVANGAAVRVSPAWALFPKPYNPCTQAVKQLLLSGKAGSVLGVRGFVTWSRGKDYYRNSGWRGSLAREGGGVLINQSVHTLDLMTYFAGKPEEVEASMQNHHLKGVIEVEDTMEAYIRYENGGTRLLLCHYSI